MAGSFISMLKKSIHGLSQLELAEVNSANSPNKLDSSSLRFLAGLPWPATRLFSTAC
jgi:hypothetical protein